AALLFLPSSLLDLLVLASVCLCRLLFFFRTRLPPLSPLFPYTTLFRSFPHLAKTYKEFHKDGFEIYAVSLDEKRSDWLKALKEERASNNIPWINLEDAGMDSKSATAYGVQSLPSNFLISGDGKVVGRNIRDWGVENAVRKLFGKSSHESR